MAKFDFRDSKVAYRVLRRIRLEEGSYLTEIKEKEDMSQGQASDALGVLKEENLIVKGERTRVQNYEIDYNSLANILAKLYSQNTDEMNVDSFEGFLGFLEENRGETINKEGFKELIRLYIKNYLSLNKKSTIQEMLTVDFFQAINNTHYLDIIFPKLLVSIRKSLPTIESDPNTIPIIVRSAIEYLNSELDEEDIRVELDRSVFPAGLPRRVDRFLEHLYSSEGEIPNVGPVEFRCERCGGQILWDNEELSCNCRTFDSDSLRSFQSS